VTHPIARIALIGMLLGLVFLSGLGAGRSIFKDDTFGVPVDEFPGCAAPADIFLLAGQSNMEGAGPLTESTTISRVFVFGSDFNYYEAKEPVSELGKSRSQFSRWIRPGGVGPGLSFAANLLNVGHQRPTPPRCVVLVPVARGGTNIQSWQHSMRPGTLYFEMLERARAASLAGQIAGLLFFQGENDAEGKTEDRPHEWGVYFIEFVNDIRTDLGIPDLPVIFAQIKSDDGLGGVVKKQQADVSVHHVAMIKTDDLATQAEATVHFTTESYREIGRRFAEAYVGLATSVEPK
jgi:hypothetical protein